MIPKDVYSGTFVCFHPLDRQQIRKTDLRTYFTEQEVINGRFSNIDELIYFELKFLDKLIKVGKWLIFTLYVFTIGYSG